MLDSHLSGPQNIYQDFDGIAIFFYMKRNNFYQTKNMIPKSGQKDLNCKQTSITKPHPKLQLPSDLKEQ